MTATWGTPGSGWAREWASLRWHSLFFAGLATQDPAAPTAPPAAPNDTILTIAALLGLAAGACFIIAIVFRHFYRQADAAMAELDQEKG